MSREHRSICVVALALALLSAPLSARGTLHVFSGYDGAVAPAGDVDLDGHPDALLAKAPQPSAIGRVAIVSGASGAPLVLVNGPVPGDGFGHAIAGARDLSSDGQPDFVVGASDGVPALGAPPYVRACLFVRACLSSPPTLGTAYGPPGSRFGSALALDADLDGDGVADLPVGAPDEGPAQAGAVHVLSRGRAARRFASTRHRLRHTIWPAASSASIGPDLTVLAASVQGAKPGLLLWSLGPDGTPFGGGYLCIASPLRRTTAVTPSGSSSNCDGALAWTFTTSYLAAQGLGAGVEVFTQFWMRDPGFAGANAIGLMRGQRFTVWP